MSKWSHNKSISAKTINRPVEAVFQRNSFRRQLSSHRCLVPISGFYAWKPITKKQRVPYYFHAPEHPLMAIGGMWEEFEDTDGVLSHSFILLTVPASQGLLSFETDMPAILTPAQGLKFLETREEDVHQELLQSITSNHPSLTSHPVSPAIASSEKNDPLFIQAVPPTDQHGNYTLFT
jgi:putative SOS response-associated peptidase YedK